MQCRKRVIESHNGDTPNERAAAFLWKANKTFRATYGYKYRGMWMELLSSRTRSSFSANCFVSATCQTIPTVAAGRRRPNCLVTKEDQQMGTTLPRPPPPPSVRFKWPTRAVHYLSLEPLTFLDGSPLHQISLSPTPVAGDSLP